MAKDKPKPNLRCNKCRAQTECVSLKDTLNEMRCGLNGGHIDDSCKINLTLDGKAVFGIHKLDKNGKPIIEKPPKEDPPKDGPPAESETSETAESDAK